MAKNKHPGENPVLAGFAKKLEANYRQRLEFNTELDRIAMIKTVHERLKVGPGRAQGVLTDYEINRKELAKIILEDYGPDKHTGDKDILHTKSTLAAFVKRVFGKTWEDVKIFFPLLKEYW